MKKKFTLSVAAFVTASYLYSPAVSAETQHNDKPLEVIVVTGRQAKTGLDIPGSIKVIGSGDIQASGAASLEDVLRGQAGIQVSDSNSGAVFSLRGFGARQAANNILVLVDGRRLNNIDIAPPSLSAVPLNQIERVEVLSGSAGVLYGDQAVGGVINIITRSPAHSGGSVYLAGGNFKRREVRAAYSGDISENWSFYLTGNHLRTDNYRKHNDSETGSVLGRVEYEKDAKHFFVESSYYDNNREYPAALSEEEYNTDPRQGGGSDFGHTISKVSRLGYSQNISKVWRFDSELSYDDSSTTGISGSSDGFPSPYRNQRSLLHFSPKVLADYATDDGNLNVIFGSDLTRGKSEFIGGFNSGRTNTQKSAGVYTQATVPLTKELEYVVGGRYSDVKDELIDPNTFAHGDELSNNAHALELGVNYRPDTSNRLYLRAEDNFRFAKVDEQAYSNPNGLRPQTGRSYEAGWDFSNRKHILKVSLYQLELEDEIVFDSSATTPPGGAFPGANVNADESKRVGIDTDWNWRLTDNLNFGAEYHYTDAEFTGGVNKGKALPWVAENTGRLHGSFDVTDDLQLYAEANYVGRRYIEGDNANAGGKLGSYTLLNAAINYRRNNWLASLRFDNLLDKEYVSAGYYSDFGAGYYPGDGRSWKFSLQYQF